MTVLLPSKWIGKWWALRIEWKPVAFLNEYEIFHLFIFIFFTSLTKCMHAYTVGYDLCKRIYFLSLSVRIHSRVFLVEIIYGWLQQSNWVKSFFFYVFGSKLCFFGPLFVSNLLRKWSCRFYDTCIIFMRDIIILFFAHYVWLIEDFSTNVCWDLFVLVISQEGIRNFLGN